GVGYLLDDVEPESEAVPSSGRVAPAEGSEEWRNQLRTDRISLVVHRHLEPDRVPAIDRDPDRRPCPAVLQRVHDQVGDRLAEAHLVEHSLSGAENLEGDAAPLVPVDFGGDGSG